MCVCNYVAFNVHLSHFFILKVKDTCVDELLILLFQMENVEGWMGMQIKVINFPQPYFG